MAFLTLFVLVPPSERAALKAREDFYDFESRVGKVTAVNDKDRNSGGFYCALCDVLLRDSLSYTNHINGRKHLRKAGISEYTERSTLEDVKAVLEYGRRKKYPERYPVANLPPTSASYSSTNGSDSRDPKAHSRSAAGDESIEPPLKKAKKSESSAASSANDVPQTEEEKEMMESFGFASFGGKKK